MGCDVHLHTEIKINGKWEHYSQPDVDRNYQLFAKMAGVRGHEDPISEPKGLPEDASATTKFDAECWGKDAHTHSWLDANEIAQLEEWWEATYHFSDFPEKQWGYLFGNSWGGFTKYPEERPEGLEDVRFVFWFDN